VSPRSRLIIATGSDFECQQAAARQAQWRRELLGSIPGWLGRSRYARRDAATLPSSAIANAIAPLNSAPPTGVFGVAPSSVNRVAHIRQSGHALSQPVRTRVSEATIDAADALDAVDGDAVVNPRDAAEALADADAADREAVENERTELREFIKELSMDDIKSGGWFTKLIAKALSSYTEKVDWRYFQERYEGVPADAIVDQRIKMAARYAALEGGLSASAYTAAIVATLGSGGGASPATVPAAVATVMVDVAFVTQLQLRLAYDISVLYRVPLDLSDPEDMWKLIRVAFTIKGGEFIREGVIKIVPAMMRPLIKRFYSRAVLTAAKGLPFVGKFLLQRTVIKVGIPLVGIPFAVTLNYYSTLVAGRHARAVFRNEARVIELAEGLSRRSEHPQLMLWIAWLVITVDKKIADDEALLIRHLTRVTREDHQIIDTELARLVNLDAADVWRRLKAESGDLSYLVDVAEHVARVDGTITAAEEAIISELRRRSAKV
jgi:hypothetical protein